MKRSSTSYVIRELQIKTTKRHYYIPIRIMKIQNTDNTKFWREGMKQQELSFVGGDSLAGSYKTIHILNI